MEQKILLFIQDCIRTPFLTPLFQLITALGNSAAVWIAIALFLLIFSKTRGTGRAVLIALILSLLVNNLLLKNLVGRARPFDTIRNLVPLIAKPRDYSFPSGHTASSFAAAGVLYRSLPRKFGIPAIVLAALIGFSRLYLGVHYPSDVICGMASGLLISLCVCTQINKQRLPR